MHAVKCQFAVRISQITKLAHGGAQWLKWNIRGEATAHQLWGPQLGGCGLLTFSWSLRCGNAASQ